VHHVIQQASCCNERNTVVPHERLNEYGSYRANIKTTTIMKIQANASGTRSIEVSEEHLQTIERYSLLKNLVDSNGIVDEAVLDKLKLNVRSILESQPSADKSLLDLCLDVIYNPNMKALGLHNLVLLYIEYTQKEESEQ
jgi:hypothetical protein